MNLLLDTHVWLWWLLDDSRLTKEGRVLIENPRNRILVSAISLWEVTIKSQVGKLRVDGDLVAISVDRGLEFLTFNVAHAGEVGKLIRHHGDPFDRALLAQARFERLGLVTADSTMKVYGDQVQLIAI